MSAVVSRLFAALVVLSICAARMAHATLIFVPNANFSNPDVPDGPDGGTFNTTNNDPVPVPGWIVFASNSGDGIVAGGIWDPDNVDYPGSLGNNTTLPGTAGFGQAAYLYLSNELTPSPQGARLTTVESLATIGNNLTYTLTVAVGVGESYTNGQVSIQLLAGDAVMAEEFIEAEEIAVKGTFSDYVVSYTTAPGDGYEGQELRVRLVHTFDGVGEASVDFTNVRLDVIPEPGSASLLLAGLTALTMRRLRRN